MIRETLELELKQTIKWDEILALTLKDVDFLEINNEFRSKGVLFISGSIEGFGFAGEYDRIEE